MIVSFESKHGPLQYATDLYRSGAWRSDLAGWQCNLRAIALGLEALRKVDRYGITKSGEQYRGWKAIGAGEPIAMGAAMTVDEAARFVADHSGEPADGGDLYDFDDSIDRAMLDRLYRAAAKRLHPDTGGDAELFKRLQDARRVLDEAARQ